MLLYRLRRSYAPYATTRRVSTRSPRRGSLTPRGAFEWVRRSISRALDVRDQASAQRSTSKQRNHTDR